MSRSSKKSPAKKSPLKLGLETAKFRRNLSIILFLSITAGFLSMFLSQSRWLATDLENLHRQELFAVTVRLQRNPAPKNRMRICTNIITRIETNILISEDQSSIRGNQLLIKKTPKVNQEAVWK